MIYSGSNRVERETEYLYRSGPTAYWGVHPHSRDNYIQVTSSFIPIMSDKDTAKRCVAET
jgi:hypothetical protein